MEGWNAGFNRKKTKNGKETKGIWTAYIRDSSLMGRVANRRLRAGGLQVGARWRGLILGMVRNGSNYLGS